MASSSSSRRGYLLILNIQRDREGSNYDAKNLERVFETMGAEVNVVTDPNEKVVKTKMAELRKKDFTDFLYVAVAYFSHGTEDDGVLTASESELINAQKTLLIPLSNNETLNGKLKWLIMQNCRGSYDFAVQKPEGPVAVVKYPRYYLKCFATSPCMRAYRTEFGSFFIENLCLRLLKEYQTLDVVSIMENT
ncbi:uncharacterized protein LOC129940714 isoform X2 [Eupeodes corollae]|uniref:uncharacterized protein LOC129940714 isoform X2 n=1 Tax=Eupeodes corollae TaxID=290404 RepID=UPI0024921596|nr:uncharacterized protein LOC129940714 isoform X2 [Eupeodes corollae]